MTFPLFTSIPPNSDYMPFVENWRASGFRVISINNAEEVALLDGVETIAVKSAEKRLPLSTILAAIQQTGEPFAGIINADCKLLAPLDCAALLRHAERSVILAERIDVDQCGAPAMYRAHGFDAMFFDTRAITPMKMNHTFRLGTPWWDYWLPHAFEVAGLKIKRFNCPVLLHETHSSKWDAEMWAVLARQMQNELPRYAFATLPHGQMAMAAYERLRSSPTIPGLPDPVAKLIEAIPLLTTRIMLSGWRQPLRRLRGYFTGGAAPG
jgi:hypothetical protein